ncbi:MAG: replicative DNA helicase, partial [Ruminococcus sp.]|nr:replicative DNA helicase [Ruminococcus sp.]
MPGVENYTSVSGSAVFGRELPYSQEAEEAVIGSILLDPENCMPKAAELLTPECFYRPQHQQLFSIFMRKFSTGVTNDVLLVIED